MKAIQIINYAVCWYKKLVASSTTINLRKAYRAQKQDNVRLDFFSLLTLYPEFDALSCDKKFEHKLDYHEFQRHLETLLKDEAVNTNSRSTIKNEGPFYS